MEREDDSLETRKPVPDIDSGWLILPGKGFNESRIFQDYVETNQPRLDSLPACATYLAGSSSTRVFPLMLTLNVLAFPCEDKTWKGRDAEDMGECKQENTVKMGIEYKNVSTYSWFLADIRNGNVPR